MGQIDPAEAARRLTRLDEAFRPSGPVTDANLFAGRLEQLASVAEAVTGVGQHVVIYGERGVGKTSLASVSSLLQRGRGAVTMRVNCDPSDNFASLWRKVTDELVLEQASGDADYARRLREPAERAADVLLEADEVGPSQVRLATRHLSNAGQVVVVFDEFDQLADRETKTMFSNTIKLLSDNVETTTLVAVGVADSVHELIAGHESIARALVQVQMPRMALGELRQIIDDGLARLDLTITDDAAYEAVIIPQGFPQFAHLLGQEGARQALLHDRGIVGEQDMDEGMRVAASKLEATLTQAYVRATASARSTTFPDVLLACALASVDELGFFSPADVRRPYSIITGSGREIAHFNPQLQALAEERGEPLERVGEPRRRRFRFRDPMMQPYIILRGVADGRVQTQMLRSLRGD